MLFRSANSNEIKQMLHRYQQELEVLQRDLDAQDGQALFERFQRAQAAREGPKF